MTITIPEDNTKYPQDYSIVERISIIKKLLDDGFDFRQIGRLMGGVSAKAIEYHYNRYVLNKPYLTPAQKRNVAAGRKPFEKKRKWTGRNYNDLNIALLQA